MSFDHEGRAVIAHSPAWGAFPVEALATLLRSRLDSDTRTRTGEPIASNCAPRPRPIDRNGTYQTRSRPRAGNSPSPSSRNCHDVRPAGRMRRLFLDRKSVV